MSNIQSTDKDATAIPTRASLLPLGDIVEQTFNDLQEAASRDGSVSGIPTGFSRLDQRLGGLMRGDLIVIAGRPCMGKTALALCVAVNAARLTNRPVAFFSREMCPDNLARRLLSCEGRTDASKMRSNRLERADWLRLVQALNGLSEVALHLGNPAVSTPGDIRAQCEALRGNSGLGLVIVDGLQLLYTNAERRSSGGAEISDVLLALKDMARELDVPVVVTSQLNRKVEYRPDHRPLLSDLRETAAVEAVADVVLFVYRDEVYTKEECAKPGVAEIIVGKNRSGPMGTFEVRFLSEYTRFEDVQNE